MYQQPMQPGMKPGMYQPGMMQPGMMQPGMMQPGMMQPGMMQPGMMQPGMMQPGMYQPGMMQPGMMQPGMMQPGMKPGMYQPGMMQPVAVQPVGIPPKPVHAYGGYQFVNGRPIYPAGIAACYPTIPVGPGMYMKPTWSRKREEKLAKLYRKCMKDGVFTPREMQKCLKKFGYLVSDQHALQILFMMDTNRDGRLDFGEFVVGMKQFVTVYPRTRKVKELKKQKKYKLGY